MNFMLRSLLRVTLSGVAAASLAALSPSVIAQTSDDAKAKLTDKEKREAKYPKQELSPKILFEFILGEMAARRGQFPLAVGLFTNLAKTTGDARIAQRATEIAHEGRQFGEAMEMAKLWQSLDPESVRARQAATTILLASGRIEELSSSLAKELADGGDKRGEAMVALFRAFGRYPDRAAVQRLFETLTAPYPNLPESHYVRALAAYGVRDLVRAVREIDEALALRPEWEQAVLLKAELMPRGAAQTDYLRSFAASHADADNTRLFFAQTLFNEKRYEAALAEFKVLLLKYPDNSDFLFAVGILSMQIGDLKTAEEKLTRFLQLGRGDLDAARYDLAIILEQVGRTDEALARYREVSGGLNLVPARVHIAQILQKRKKFDEASEALQAARLAQPDDARLIVAESQLLRDRGRHKEALQLLNAALIKLPDQPDLLYEAALLDEKLGDLPTMERRLRRLIELKPDSAMAYNALGYSYADRNMRLDEAAQLIDKALSLTPDDPFILDSKAWVLFRQGKGNDALEILKRIAVQKPDPEISAHLGEVLWSLGRRDEAVNIWQAAAKDHPDNEALTATIKRFKP